MDATTIEQSGRVKRVLPGRLEDVARAAVLCGVGLTLLVSLIFFARRLAGALAAPLSPVVLLAVAGIAVSVGWLLRHLWRRHTRRNSLRNVRLGGAWDSFAYWAPVAALGLLGIALSSDGVPFSTLMLFWAVLVGSEVAALRHFGHGGPLVERFGRWSHRRGRTSAYRGSAERTTPPGERDQAGTETQESGRTGAEVPETGPIQVAPSDLCPSQELIRATDAEGSDVLFGSVWAEFSAGERDAVVHVAFCPAFSGAPTVDVEQTDGPDARIKVAQVIPTGVRVEARLRQAAKSKTRVGIEISVRQVSSIEVE